MVNRGAARHFADSAEGYSTFRNTGLLGRIRRQEQRAVHELVSVEKAQLVLDAGCGDGATLGWLAAKKAQAIGIDISLAMAHATAQDGHRTAVQDMELLGFPPIFDWVLCIGSLEFVVNPLNALARLRECLVPGGSLVLLYPRRGPLGSLYTLYHRSHGTKIHTFSDREASKILVQAGFAEPHGKRRCVLANVCVARRERDDTP